MKFSQLSSKYFSQQLIKQGCVPKKSLILTWPTNLPQDLYPHFIRGYFDGDGSIFWHKRLRNMGISIVGTKDICDGVKLFCDLLNINAHIRERKQKNIYYELTIGGNIQVSTFMNAIYKDNTFCLLRKKEKYNEFVKEINECQINKNFPLLN